MIIGYKSDHRKPKNADRHMGTGCRRVESLIDSSCWIHNQRTQQRRDGHTESTKRAHPAHLRRKPVDQPGAQAPGPREPHRVGDCNSLTESSLPARSSSACPPTVGNVVDRLT
jgi:hypothetical protein